MYIAALASLALLADAKQLTQDVQKINPQPVR
jgi:hypothetical protein